VGGWVQAALPLKDAPNVISLLTDRRGDQALQAQTAAPLRFADPKAGRVYYAVRVDVHCYLVAVYDAGAAGAPEGSGVAEQLVALRGSLVGAALWDRLQRVG
jgi:hypothetical protein